MASADNPDNRLQQLGSFIRDQRTGAELSLRKLADLTGVSNPYLSQIERGMRRPSAEILQQIAKALSISAETMYIQAGLLDEDAEREQQSAPVEAAIAADPDLTDDQRRTLLHIYRSFTVEADDDAT